MKIWRDDNFVRQTKELVEFQEIVLCSKTSRGFYQCQTSSFELCMTTCYSVVIMRNKDQKIIKMIPHTGNRVTAFYFIAAYWKFSSRIDILGCMLYFISKYRVSLSKFPKFSTWPFQTNSFCWWSGVFFFLSRILQYLTASLETMYTVQSLCAFALQFFHQNYLVPSRLMNLYAVSEPSPRLSNHAISASPPDANITRCQRQIVRVSCRPASKILRWRGSEQLRASGPGDGRNCRKLAAYMTDSFLPRKIPSYWPGGRPHQTCNYGRCAWWVNVDRNNSRGHPSDFCFSWDIRNLLRCGW